MKQEKSEIIIDIGSASVGVAVFKESHDTPLSLSHVHRVPIQAGSLNVAGEIQKHALEALRTAVAMLPKSLTLSSVEIFFAAPWYMAETKVIYSESTKPIRITEPTILHVIQKEREQRVAVERQGRHQVESVVSSLIVNGYPTTLLKPLKGTSLTVHLYESEVDTDFREAIYRILMETFPHVHQNLHTFLLATCSTLSTLRSEENFTLIDVGGEITDIGVVQKGSLRSVVSFPLGTRSMLNALRAGGSSADTLSRLTLFIKNELSAEETKLFQSRFENATKEWTNSFLQATTKVNVPDPLPRTVFLLADGESLEWLQRAILQLPHLYSENIVLMTPQFFQKELSLGDGGAYDAFLSVEALFLRASMKRFLTTE